MKKMARLLVRAATRLLHALQPAQMAIGWLQHRWRVLTYGLLLRLATQHA
jgi:hypothetical protein